MTVHSWEKLCLDDRGVVTMLMETRNQHDKVVQRATGKLLVFRTPPPD